MPKLYFKYGAMGSSKTAQALMVKFNYEEKGYRVGLMKPEVDNRDGDTTVRSRIGLKDTGILIRRDMNLYDWYQKNPYDVLIIDEAQFLSEEQINQLKDIAIEFVPVLCFGLKTDFQTHLFEGSRRLFEIADSLMEIKSVCTCGRKAEVNARIHDGKIVREGEQIFIGGNESYIGLCYDCWQKGKINPPPTRMLEEPDSF
ncbi:thymidine kinase [Caproiciproducens sp. LBM24188]|nr:thymidine kinase [Oscillospiraceae bacterium]HHV32274.1 thymidine kinase [Clostridiales bacterium]